MTTKHTPAPWEALNDFGVFRILNGKGSAIEIAQIKITGDGEEDFDEAEANAKLIAAAPDLLEALIACNEAMEYMSEYDIPLTLPQQVKDAIAKALGE